MRKAACVFGVIWMAGAIAVGLIFLARYASVTHAGAGRGVFFLLLIAALPGLLIYRWGRSFS